MNLHHLLAVLRARWLPAVSVFLLVMGAAVAITMLSPKRYLATASVVIDARPDPVSSMLYGGGVSPALINTQVEVIGSERVALRVLRALRLTEVSEIRQEWEASGAGGSIESWLVGRLQRGLEVSVARAGGNVINISYQATDPQFAAAAANAFTQAYIDTAVELRVDPARQYNAFFEQQVQQARAALERAQSSLSAFQKDKGILATDGRYDVEASRLESLSQQLVAMQGTASDSSLRQAQAANNGERLQEVLASARIGGLKGEVTRAESRLQELNSRLGDNHPQVQEARTTLAQLRRELAAETSNVTAAVGVTARIDRSREAEVRAALEAQRQKLLKLQEVRDEGAVLGRNVESAQRAYDLVLARYNQTNLESQNRQSTATVLTQASRPDVPTSPKVLANLLMGLFFGTALGLGLALLMERLDQRVRSASDAVHALGLPVIGIMPTPRLGRVRGKALAMQQQRVVYGRRLPGPGGRAA